MEMFYQSSGKLGYDPFFSPTEFKISRELLIEILKREDHLRRNDQKFQKAYGECGTDLKRIRDVTLRIQLQALRDFGISDYRGLIVLNNARHEFKDDPEINKLTVYMREDISNRGTLQPKQDLPNANLLTLSGEETTLHQYIQDHQLLTNARPLILYDSQIEFLAVYILEAHASDKWPLGDQICVPQHKTQEERLQVANRFVNDYNPGIPVLVDTMDNNFNATFAAWPQRFFIAIPSEKIDGNSEKRMILDVVGVPSVEFGFDRDVIEHWCEEYLNC